MIEIPLIEYIELLECKKFGLKSVQSLYGGVEIQIQVLQDKINELKIKLNKH